MMAMKMMIVYDDHWMLMNKQHQIVVDDDDLNVEDYDFDENDDYDDQ